MNRLYEFDRDLTFTSSSKYFMEEEADQLDFRSRYQSQLDELDSDDYNYYTGSDEDYTDSDDEFEYSRTRRVIGAISPIILTSGVGGLIAW